MKTWDELEAELRSAADALTLRSRERLGRSTEHFEIALAWLHGTLGNAFRAEGNAERSTRRLALAALYTYCLGRLVNAYQMVLRGYLSDGVVLSRAAFEGLWLAIDLDIDATDSSPDVQARIDAWMAGSQFVATRDTIKRRGEQNKRLKERWGALSDLSHPGKFGAVSLAFATSEPGRPGHYRVGLFGIDQPPVSDLLIHIMWEVLMALIDYAPLAFPSSVDDMEEYENQAEAIRERLQAFERERVLPTWRQLFTPEPDTPVGEGTGQD